MIIIDWENNKVYLDQNRTVEVIDGWFRYCGLIYNVNLKDGITKYTGSYKDLIEKITYKK
jgi:hypothetical protein